MIEINDTGTKLRYSFLQPPGRSIETQADARIIIGRFRLFPLLRLKVEMFTNKGLSGISMTYPSRCCYSVIGGVHAVNV